MPELSPKTLYNNPGGVLDKSTIVEIRRRIRKRGEKAEDLVIKPVVQEEEPTQVVISQEQTEEEEESQDWISREALRQDQGTFTTTKGINEISAELTDDKRSQLVESNFWDETHSWGSDHELASDDYWHFVGRYE